MCKHLFKIILIASLLLIILVTTSLSPATALADEPPDVRDATQEPDPVYLATIQNTAAMVSNEQAQSLVAQYGLNIVNVTWEDTGRYNNSAVGPNISDMTIQVQSPDPATGGYE